MKIKELKNKKVLILGFGREGVDSFVFLRRVFPKQILFVADKKNFEEMNLGSQKLLKDKKTGLFLGDDYLNHIKGFDVIIKSPGISLNSIKKYLSKKTKVTSQTELFFDNCLGNIIGITGTKGKSTTSSLIHSVLKEAGVKSYLVGNIETPSLSFLLKAKKDDVFVYELSSHQLQFLEKSPHIGLFLNIYPEHLDYYKNFKEYFSAKANIAKYQKKNDYFIFNSKFKEIKKLAEKVKSKKIEINTDGFSKFFKDHQEFLEITHVDNLNAVMNVFKILGIKEEKIIKAFKKFKRPDHRLEFIGEHKGIRFYDDSISTIDEAAIFALDSLGNDVETIILGGFDRGVGHSKIAERLIKSRVKTLILFNPSGEEILKEIKRRKGKMKHIFVKNMEEAVTKAYSKTSIGHICLLSPASPSFGTFIDYKDRGDQFKKFVIKYGK